MRRHVLSRMFCQTLRHPPLTHRHLKTTEAPRLCTARELLLEHLGKHGAVSTPTACVFYYTVALWTLVVFACAHNSTLSRVLDELEHLRGDPVSFFRVLKLHSLHVLSKHWLRSELFKTHAFSPWLGCLLLGNRPGMLPFFPLMIEPKVTHGGLWSLIIFPITWHKSWHMVCLVNIALCQCLQAEFTRSGKLIACNLPVLSPVPICTEHFIKRHRKVQSYTEAFPQLLAWFLKSRHWSFIHLAQIQNWICLRVILPVAGGSCL